MLEPFNPNQEAETNEITSANNVRLTQAETPKREHGDKQEATSVPSHQATTKTVYSPGMYSNISNTDYHASAGTSSTNLKITLESMRKYQLAITGQLPFNQTPAIKLGCAVHAYTLEPENFHNEIAIRPELSHSKTDKILILEFEENNKGKVLITKDQAESARLMRDSIMAHPEVAQLFKNSTFEQSGYYIDEYTGLSCKYRPDIRNDYFIADVKSTSDVSPAAFARTIVKFGYHVSAAHYLEGDRTLHGTNHRQFIFIAVENKYPFEVAVYTLAAKSLERGYELRARGLNRILEANETGYYPLVNGGIAQEIEIPNWGFYDD